MKYLVSNEEAGDNNDITDYYIAMNFSDLYGIPQVYAASPSCF